MGAGKGKNRRVQNKRTLLGRRKTVKTMAQYKALPEEVQAAWERSDDDYQREYWEYGIVRAAARVRDISLRKRYPVDAGALMTEAATEGGVGWDYQ